MASERKRKLSLTKDRQYIQFWENEEAITKCCALKANNPHWGASRVTQELQKDGLMTTAAKVKTWIDKYFVDNKTKKLYLKPTKPFENHRLCLSKDELIKMIAENHALDHRAGRSIYNSLRRTYYPCNRDNVSILFDSKVLNNCEKCNRVNLITGSAAAKPPKPVTATYPNSRWQIDLKKMPSCRGYKYVMNIIDVYSRHAFGSALKTKKVSLLC
jgi:hypothetical protein